jgi:hypothetical protein
LSIALWNDLSALAHCRWGKGFFGGNGGDARSADTVAVIASPLRIVRQSKELYVNTGPTAALTPYITAAVGVFA